MDKVDLLLRLLREDGATAWVSDQVVSSFVQGVSMNVKDAQSDAGFGDFEPIGLTNRERRQREKYETTRPYSEQEKLQLLDQALKTLFVVLPAIQIAGLRNLGEFDGGATEIKFVPPDEPELGRSEYTIELASTVERTTLLFENFRKFEEKLVE
jgi:hypothetical protein